MCKASEKDSGSLVENKESLKHTYKTPIVLIYDLDFLNGGFFYLLVLFSIRERKRERERKLGYLIEIESFPFFFVYEIKKISI